MKLTPEILKDLYLVQLKTETEIAGMFGTSQVQVGRLRKKWGIPTLGKTGRLEKLLPPVLTSEQEEVLIGSLLGDGCLKGISEKTALYTETHGPSQYAYLDWKAEILGPFALSVYPTMKRVGDKEFPGRGFTTHASTVLRPYYDMFYPAPSRKKVFPVDLSKRLTPLALAVWYMDDGSLAGTHTARIAFGLDPLSLERALQALRDLGFNPVAYGKKGNQAIWLTGDTHLFLDLTGKYVSEHMPQKLPCWTERQKGDLNAEKLTPELAAELYSGNSTVEDIAEKFGVGTSTVKRRLRDAETPMRRSGPRDAEPGDTAMQPLRVKPSFQECGVVLPCPDYNGPIDKSNYQWAKKAGLTPDTLRVIYAKYGDEEIAELFGVSGVAVGVQRKKWGIESISARQRRDKVERKGLPSLDNLTPEGLKVLSKTMGDQKIAAMHGVQKPAVSRLREQWDIAATSKSERATSETILTDEQKEACIGTLLGDAHLTESGSLRVSHSHDQIGYLKALRAILVPYARPIHYSESSMPSGQVCFTFGFKTVQHMWLKELRNIFYPEPEKVKVFPESIIRTLTPLSLAYWYFDDGHWGDVLYIALGPISDYEKEYIPVWLKDRFGFDSYIKGKPNCRLLFIRGASHEIFFNLIRNYAIPDMLYKFPPKYRPAGILPIHPVRTTPQIKIPPDLLEGCEDWLSKTSVQQEQTVDDLCGFWRSQGFPHCEIRPEELITLLEVTPDQIIHEGVIRPRQVGQSLCHAFMPHIWKARSRSSEQSPFDLFSDDTTLKGALRYLLEKGSKPTAAGLRGALRYWRYSGVYNFRPSAAKALVDTYCVPGGTVWDPCAGYGGRLLGTLLSRNSPKYIACEPQSETFCRLQELAGWLEKYLPDISSRVQLNHVPAEEFKLPEYVDMVFTSPPYWQQEVYGEEETQSGIRYKTYEAWLEGFWKPVLRQAVAKLKAGGWLVLNVDTFVANHKTYDLPGDTIAICKSFGFDREPETLRYAMNGDNYESVLCWKKAVAVVEDSVPVPIPSVPNQVIVSRCENCGITVPIGGIKDGKCPECRVPGGHRTCCKGCGEVFQAVRKDREFCDEACRARWRRREFRKVHPAKTTRTFTCQFCGKKWESSELGSPNKCTECKAAKELASRTKVCQYRHCGQTFVDTSEKNSMSYCHVEHRRREKLLRSGMAPDLSYFTKPDPVLDTATPAMPASTDSPTSQPSVSDLFGMPPRSDPKIHSSDSDYSI